MLTRRQAAGLSLLAAPSIKAKPPVRVLVWSERTEPAEIYPEGIHGAIAGMLTREKDIHAATASLGDAEQGLGEPAMASADVLVAFGHRYHKVVSDENAARIVRHVDERGMGYVALHSSYAAKAFQAIMAALANRRGTPLGGEPGSWALVRDLGRPYTVHVREPHHPIAKGIVDFTIPRSETYYEPSQVPAPDARIFEGRGEAGQPDGGDGLLWEFGKGKVFYLRQGHETYPIYFQPQMQRILLNAVRFLAQGARR